MSYEIGLAYEVATVMCGGPGLELPGDVEISAYDNACNIFTPCQAYQDLLVGTDADVLIYAHDDVTVHESDWLRRVMSPFELLPFPDEVVAVGLGGALSLGRPNLYKEPYNIWNLARGGYMSNQTDAEVHGERFTGTRPVAVLDAFFMAVRTDFLRSIGGWPVSHLSHHMLDAWLACQAARHKKEIWLVGASVTHHGGGSSTKPIYRNAKWLQGGTLESDHTIPHRYIYEEFRDVLPIVVPR